MIQTAAMLLTAALLGRAPQEGPSPVPTEAASFLEFAVPPPAPSDGLRWIGSYRDAVDEARVRNCPILVVMSHDQSEGFRTVGLKVYVQPGFRQVVDGCVLLIAFRGEQHPSEKRVVAGEEVEWCRLFDVPCEEHRQAYELIRSEFAAEEFWNPLHLFLSPDTVELGRRAGHEVELSDFESELAAARAKVGRSLPYSQYRAVLAALRELLDTRFKKSHARVLQGLDALIEERTADRGLLPFLERTRRELLAEGERMLAAAEQARATGDDKEARAILIRVMRSFRGHPPARRARELLKERKRSG